MHHLIPAPILSSGNPSEHASFGDKIRNLLHIDSSEHILQKTRLALEDLVKLRDRGHKTITGKVLDFNFDDPTSLVHREVADTGLHLENGKISLRWFTFVDCVFTANLSISDIDFSHSVFKSCAFDTRYFRNCDFSHARFVDLDIVRSGMDLYECNLTNVSSDLSVNVGIPVGHVCAPEKISIDPITSKSVFLCTDFEGAEGGWEDGHKKRVAAFELDFFDGQRVPFLLFASFDGSENGKYKLAILFSKDVLTKDGTMYQGVFYSLPNEGMWANAEFRDVLLSRILSLPFSPKILQAGKVSLPLDSEIVFRPFRPASLATKGFVECIQKGFGMVE